MLSIPPPHPPPPPLHHVTPLDTMRLEDGGRRGRRSLLTHIDLISSLLRGCRRSHGVLGGLACLEMQMMMLQR